MDTGIWLEIVPNQRLYRWFNHWHNEHSARYFCIFLKSHPLKKYFFQVCHTLVWWVFPWNTASTPIWFRLHCTSFSERPGLLEWVLLIFTLWILRVKKLIKTSCLFQVPSPSPVWWWAKSVTSTYRIRRLTCHLVVSIWSAMPHSRLNSIYHMINWTRASSRLRSVLLPGK